MYRTPGQKLGPLCLLQRSEKSYLRKRKDQHTYNDPKIEDTKVGKIS